MCNLINTHTHTHTYTHTPWEDQREWNRMTRMTGPDCAVMCNLINTHTPTHTHTHISTVLWSAGGKNVLVLCTVLLSVLQSILCFCMRRIFLCFTQSILFIVVVAVVDSHVQRVVLEAEETTVTHQVSHRPIKCQSRLWSQRGTKVNGSHHGDNPAT